MYKVQDIKYNNIFYEFPLDIIVHEFLNKIAGYILRTITSAKYSWQCPFHTRVTRISPYLIHWQTIENLIDYATIDTRCFKGGNYSKAETIR